ncbi:hypothetical protein Nepgr_011662 [Nepenthes gracilis]|uniref:Uncharacterized protein n=1 Tax=Nepenthes gracilis TaxID=150966 RepID=A0AAD3SG24_NEPGR|nr:hypothetical protein Nepgr_011662 [Nepenthes gracilis]
MRSSRDILKQVKMHKTTSTHPCSSICKTRELVPPSPPQNLLTPLSTLKTITGLPRSTVLRGQEIAPPNPPYPIATPFLTLPLLARKTLTNLPQSTTSKTRASPSLSPIHSISIPKGYLPFPQQQLNSCLERSNLIPMGFKNYHETFLIGIQHLIGINFVNMSKPIIEDARMEEHVPFNYQP